MRTRPRNNNPPHLRKTLRMSMMHSGIFGTWDATYLATRIRPQLRRFSAAPITAIDPAITL